MSPRANAPDPTAGPISDDVHDPSAVRGPDDDLPFWYGALLSRTPEARASRILKGRTAPLPWRAAVARWPLPLRQRWGDRANQLQDRGFDWKAAERSAFDELKTANRPAGSDPGGRD